MNLIKKFFGQKKPTQKKPTIVFIKDISVGPSWHEVGCVAISSDGRLGLTGSWNPEHVHLLDLTTGECLRIFEEHGKGINSVAISPDGQLGLSGSSDETARLWDLTSGECMGIYDSNDDVYVVAFSHDGEQIFVGSTARLLVWDFLDSNQCVQSFQWDGGMTQSIAISHDDRYVLVGTNTGILMLWEVQTGQLVKSFDVSGFDLKGQRVHTGSMIIRGAILSDGKKLLSGDRSGRIKLWDIYGGRCIRIIEAPPNITSLALIHDDKYCLSNSAGYMIKLWDLSNGKCLQTLEDVRAGWPCAVSSDGYWILSRHSDNRNTLQLWQIQ